MNKFFNFLSMAKKSGNLLEGYSKCDDYRNNTKIYLLSYLMIYQINLKINLKSIVMKKIYHILKTSQKNN